MSRTNFKYDEKVMIVREHLENQIPITDLAKKHRVKPNLIKAWQRQIFESAPESLERRRYRNTKPPELLAAEKELQKLKAQLQQRNSVISELVAENIELKKKESGHS